MRRLCILTILFISASINADEHFAVDDLVGEWRSGVQPFGKDQVIFRISAAGSISFIRNYSAQTGAICSSGLDAITHVNGIFIFDCSLFEGMRNYKLVVALWESDDARFLVGTLFEFSDESFSAIQVELSKVESTDNKPFKYVLPATLAPPDA
jgi:hypothetical protein